MFTQRAGARGRQQGPLNPTFRAAGKPVLQKRNSRCPLPSPGAFLQWGRSYPLWASVTHLVSWGLADVIGVSAHLMFLNFIQMSLWWWLLLLLPFTSSHNHPGVPSLWMGPRPLGEQRGAWSCSNNLKSACHECYLILTCFWSVIRT